MSHAQSQLDIDLYKAYKSKSSTPVQSYAPKQIGTIDVVNADGTIAFWVPLTTTYDDWWEVALKVYPVDAEGHMRIPIENCDWSESAPPFYPCTFNACEDYFQAIWGRKLHKSDKDWLALHPFAKDEGLPEAYTPTALHQLLEPYGFGVSRIRVRQGKYVMGDEMWSWAKALGCNPFGLVDKNTSNHDAAKLLGMSVEEANAQFRFEYHKKPLRGSVIGEKGWSSSAGAGIMVGSSGGHSTYLPPRGSYGDWTISIQFAPLDRITYLEPPQLPEYKPRSGNRTLMVGKTKRPTGGLVAVMQGGKYRDPAAPLPATTTPATVSPALTQPHWNQVAGGSVHSRAETTKPLVTSPAQHRFACTGCNTLLPVKDREAGTEYCQSCWTAAWVGTRCPACEKTLGSTWIETPIVQRYEFLTDTALLRCPHCQGNFEVVGITKEENAVAEALRASDEYRNALAQLSSETATTVDSH